MSHCKVIQEMSIEESSIRFFYDTTHSVIHPHASYIKNSHRSLVVCVYFKTSSSSLLSISLIPLKFVCDIKDRRVENHTILHSQISHQHQQHIKIIVYDDFLDSTSIEFIYACLRGKLQFFEFKKLIVLLLFLSSKNMKH